MKLRRSFVLLAVPFSLTLAPGALTPRSVRADAAPIGAVNVADPGTNLEVQVAAEEPTGVFYDRDTLGPQTPILFTAKVTNPLADDRQVSLTWRVVSSDGHTIWEQSARFTIAAGQSIVRRQLFDAPARGGYLLDVKAVAKQKGRDAEAETALPFAVTIAPSPENAAMARPRSFFILTAPTMLSEGQLDFYSRIGARVLRTALPPDPAKPDWPAIEAQISARVRRNISSIALLPVADKDGRSSETYFSRQVPATLARYGALTTWELAGDLSPADLDGWSQIARSRRNDVALLGPLPPLTPQPQPDAANGVGTTVRLTSLDGATFNWPAASAHPAALQRLWLSRGSATKDAGLPAFHLRRDGDLAFKSVSPEAAAGEMTGDFLSAIVAGASSMSESLAPPGPGEPGARAMAEGAAFAMMTRTLEDASYREELYPRLPGLYGALFRSPKGAIAVLYSTGGPGKLTARVSPAKAYDTFGNPVGSIRNGALEFTLTSRPVYVVAEVAPDVLGFALRDAQASGFDSLEAQVLPLSRVAGEIAPPPVTAAIVPPVAISGGTPATPLINVRPTPAPPVVAMAPSIRVRLQNTGLGVRSGQLSLDPPSGWKLSSKKQGFSLAPGESKTYEFRVERSRETADSVNITVNASFDGTHKSWKQEVPVATASNILPGAAPRVDGDLTDWAGAKWMSAGPNDGNVSAKVAMRWDANRLFVAARVKETGLVARRPDEPAYEFWKEHDSLQLAFGVSDSSGSVPTRDPFRDSDYGFLLAPFNQRGSNEYDGRVLRLWSADKPYNKLADHIRWGGAVSGASCVITRDEKAGVTIYEARIPLTAIPELQPLERAAHDGIVRFGWMLHNDEGSPLDWGAAAGNFPWWNNTATFLPEGTLTSPLRATLGFTQIGDVDLGLEPRLMSRPAPGPVSPPQPAGSLPGMLPGSRPAAPHLGDGKSGGPAPLIPGGSATPYTPGALPLRNGSAVPPAGNSASPQRVAPRPPSSTRKPNWVAPFVVPPAVPAAPPTSPSAAPPPEDGADLPPAGTSPAPAPAPGPSPPGPSPAWPTNVRLLPLPSLIPPRAHLMPPATN